jgi:hypothetical protein
MPEYIKHLVECKCVLPQFRKLDPPPFHKFAVFSVLEEETAVVKPAYSQCPNCGAIHKVIEVSTSNILLKDSMLSLPTIEDLQVGMPEWLSALLERHECDIATWQEAKFIVENKLWGRAVVLAKERDEETIVGKYVSIFGEELYKIETFERFDGLI